MRRIFLFEYEHTNLPACPQLRNENAKTSFESFIEIWRFSYAFNASVSRLGLLRRVRPPIHPPRVPPYPPRFRLPVPMELWMFSTFFVLVKGCDSFFFHDFLLPIVCCVSKSKS